MPQSEREKSPAALPPPENKVYYPALDGFRALALILVFFDHYDGLPILGLGVNAFFVLSGFLISGILLDTKDRPDRVRTFYIRRVLRIFPLYYGLFLALLLATPILHVRWNSAWLLWPFHLGNLLPFLPPWLPVAPWSTAATGQLGIGHGYTLRLGHLWSLCLEEQFYVVWPFVVFFLSRRALLWLCSVTVLALPFVRIAASYLLPAELFHHNILLRTLPFQLDSLLLGALLALLWRGSHRVILLRWSTRLVPAACIFLAYVVLVHYRTETPLFPQPYAVDLPFLTWQFSVANLLAFVFIVASLQPASPVARLFSLPALRWIGRISYGAYVFHDMPHQLYSQLADLTAYPRLVLNLLAATSTLVLAALSYTLYERRFLQLKSRWS